MISEADLKIIGKMPIRSNEVRDNIQLLEKMQSSQALMLMSILNYGYMLGKREERAKRKNKEV